MTGLSPWLAAGGPAAGIAALLAIVPWRGRAATRAALLWVALLGPVLAMAAWLALRRGTEAGTWLLLLPLALVYLATVDLVLGVSARLSPRPPRSGRRRANWGP